ncbi:DnaD domain protein [Caproiciproducens sp. NJN-50]|uniref:DnaD domain protein n=1 Tax=Acutalibacteraceae TaxID=3082771 RepID=UPI000FFE1A7B|nr:MULTISPECIES: DnaD domain protein [Acutalibacteraceae]QAT50367.1 DnaD domain protein [Caproiciproducens sp. NJN-50]
MSYSINLGAWNSVFAVPCSVVDQNLKLAGSVQLKVLLWTLRHAGEPFEAQDIASALGIERADVRDALLYWQEAGLFSSGGTAESAKPARPETQAPSQPAGETAKPAPAAETRRVLSRPQKPDSGFVAKRIEESTDISCLMQSAQQVLGRLISGGESATLLMIHDEFGLPSDVIIMLLQYAASIGKANMRYIEKTAMNWADEEINTHERAEEKLLRLTECRQAWRQVEQALGMPHRSPSSKEEAFADTWVAQWKFGGDMIREAYDRAVDATGKFSASYMNRILERWKKANISTVQQAQRETMERAAARRDSKGSPLSQELDEFERSGIFDNFDRK